jgi:transcriptional regulator with XRE-family HTH domain
MTANLRFFLCPDCRQIVDPDDFQQRYAWSLRRILNEKQISVERLASLVGTNIRTIERWLRSETVPQLGTAVAVYVVLGRPPELDLGSGHACPEIDT